MDHTYLSSKQVNEKDPFLDTSTYVDETPDRRLFCAMVKQLLEDATVDPRFCRGTTSSASAKRVYREQAKEWFYSTSADVVSDRLMIFGDIIGMPDPADCVLKCRELIESGVPWSKIKKDYKLNKILKE